MAASRNDPLQVADTAPRTPQQLCFSREEPFLTPPLPPKTGVRSYADGLEVETLGFSFCSLLYSVCVCCLPFCARSFLMGLETSWRQGQASQQIRECEIRLNFPSHSQQPNQTVDFMRTGSLLRFVLVPFSNWAGNTINQLCWCGPGCLALS